MSRRRRVWLLLPLFAAALGVGLAEAEPAPSPTGLAPLSEVDRRYYAVWSLSPDDPEAHHDFGLALLKRSLWREAELYLRAAVDMDPEELRFRVPLGEVLAQLGQVEEAREQLAPVVGSGLASEPRAHTLLGRLAGRSGDRERALAYFRSAVELAPAEASFRFNLASSLMRNERRAEGVEQLEAALAIDPEMGRARRRLAVALLQLERFGDALPHYEILSRLNPRDPVTLYELGRVQEGVGNAHLARRSYERAFEIAHRVPHYDELVERLREKLGQL